MTCKEIIKYLENWVPRETAWEKDNTGLQVGSPDSEITSIFLCLELTERALEEALRKKSNFIITHHPLIFQPLRKLDTNSDTTAKIITRLIKNDITLYSAHTNLDFTKEGVSFQLARKLGLENIHFLQKQPNTLYKLSVFCPIDSIDQISEALFAAGAGIIGDYSKCSFRSAGKGTFLGAKESNPFIGQAGQFESVEELKLELLINKWELKKVISILHKVHPYEEPAYDIYPLLNENSQHGFGAIGTLSSEMSEDEFISHVSDKLGNIPLRYSRGHGRKVKTVAVCGGSGTELLNAAFASQADSFVTADIKYHTFHDAKGKMLLIDAGHYETEAVVLQELKKRLKKHFKTHKNNCEVYIYNKSTNPIEFFNKL